MARGVHPPAAVPDYDVIIAGGGPAGLSAALLLGRSRRRVLVCDSGQYRNDASPALHGFLSRDGIAPAELRRLGREQLEQYGVELRRALVTAARRRDSGFEVSLDDGTRLGCRKLLIATGVVDHIPETPGARELFGRGIFHCPYCDGWELRDQPLAVYGRGKGGAALALSLTSWSPDVVLCTDGPAGLRPPEAAGLRRHRIPVRQERIARFEGRAWLERLVFATGEALPRRGLFLSTGQHQRSTLAATLGCRFTRKGAVRTNRLEGSNIPGLWVAGDASHDMQLAVVAAAEGAKAGCAIHAALVREDGA